MTGTEDVAGVAVSKPDKVMFPATKGTPAITKLDVARYYAGVAAVMLPHLRGRPVNMQRFPDGIEGPSFYEKKVPGHFPHFVATVEVNTSQGPQRQVVVNDQRTLVYLANQGCLTPHTWLSRSDDLDRPDQLIFDLDPSVPDVGMVRRSTRVVAGLLNDLGLSSYLKTSGSRGYHVLVPLRRSWDFDAVRDFAREFAQVLVDRHPDLVTLEARKDKRGDRVLIDVQRNGYGQTTVPPYAVRARPGAPVSTPLRWDELTRVRPDQHTIGTLGRRLARVENPWANLRRQSLGQAARQLANLRA